ncbi:MAG TPA: hypothetical protein V6C58_04915, partial [Allocoleopsis sp.]
IHVKLFSDSTNWDFTNNTQHQFMLLNYVELMANALMEIFPNLDKLDAFCISYDGMSGGRDANEQAVFNSMRTLFFNAKILPLSIQKGINNFTPFDAHIKASEYSETGIKGTRNSSCKIPPPTGNQ